MPTQESEDAKRKDEERKQVIEKIITDAQRAERERRSTVEAESARAKVRAKIETRKLHQRLEQLQTKFKASK